MGCTEHSRVKAYLFIYSFIKPLEVGKLSISTGCKGLLRDDTDVIHKDLEQGNKKFKPYKLSTNC